MKIKKWESFKQSGSDPMECFEKICALEKSHGFRSTFYFMSLQNSIGREGRRYSVRNARLQEIVRRLSADDFEVGLHASRYGNLSVTNILKQKQRLEKVVGEPITGCRHHYLRVKYPLSWRLYAKAGIQYASNMGWDGGFNGFRAGTCFPYQPMKPKNSILEIPFQLMDAIPIPNGDDFLSRFKRYLMSVKEVGGCLVIDFHQENFNEEVDPRTLSIYTKMLEVVGRDADLLVLTMKGVCDWVSKFDSEL